MLKLPEVEQGASYSGVQDVFVRIGSMRLRFVRRSLDLHPAPEGTMCIVDNGTPEGWTDRQPAQIKEGAWVGMGGKLRFSPTHWMTFPVQEESGDVARS
jgi:hypothetical protein